MSQTDIFLACACGTAATHAVTDGEDSRVRNVVDNGRFCLDCEGFVCKPCLAKSEGFDLCPSCAAKSSPDPDDDDLDMAPYGSCTACGTPLLPEVGKSPDDMQHGRCADCISGRWSR